MTNEMETRYQHRPVCPHCGHIHQDAWEWNFGGTEGEIEKECHKCEKPFLCSRTVVVEYSTYVFAPPPESAETPRV